MLNNPKASFQLSTKNIYWLMNIDEEEDWVQNSIFPNIIDENQKILTSQQEQQLIFIADEHHTIVLEHYIDPDFLSYLIEKNIKLPKILYKKDTNLDIEDILKGDTLVIPYVNGPRIEKLREQGFNIYGSKENIVKKLNDKYQIKRLVKENGFNTTEGYFCNDLKELETAYTCLIKKGFNKMVIKLPYGSSGKGLKIINNEVQFRRLVNYLKRHCKEKVFLLIEGWHNIKRSLNSQFIIGNYETKLLSITEQIINSDGVYFGTNYTPHYKDELLKNYKKQVYEISNLIQDLGYRGIIGIDSIQDQDNIIYPTIEINARFTQVTYLLPLVSKLSKDYKFIESRIFRMNFRRKVSFLDIKRTLDRLFEKKNDLDYFIYTYAHTHHGQRNYYKLFILFMGNTQECLKGIIEDVKGMEQNSVDK